MYGGGGQRRHEGAVGVFFTSSLWAHPGYIRPDEITVQGEDWVREMPKSQPRGKDGSLREPLHEKPQRSPCLPSEKINVQVEDEEEAYGEATKEPETPRTSQSHRSRYVVAKGSEDISLIDGGNE